MLQLPIGYDNFRDLIDKDLDFVDKSLFIREVLDDRVTSVVLITRPRRFGKTLNLSMLHYFLAAEAYGQSTEGLFDGLQIMAQGEAYTQHHRKYPVLFLTFKDVKDGGFQIAYDKLYELIISLYDQFNYLQRSDRLTENQRQLYQIVLQRKANRVQIENSLKVLTECLFAHHGVKPWLLIDEYDTPIQSAYVHGYYEEMMSLMRGMLSSALKTNPYLNRAVITGILRVSKESLFSGLNNLKVYSMLQSKYGSYFGFTENEIENLLQRAGLQSQAKTIKDWYNGYLSGETVLYNPWSIANCIQEQGLIKPYWTNTSDDLLIKKILTRSGFEFKEQFERLMQGEPTEQVIDENVVFAELKGGSNAWSLLLMAGYLKVTEQHQAGDGLMCQLTIPNQEVRNRYQQITKQWLSNGHGIEWFNRFLENLLTGKLDRFEEDLTQIMEETVSVHDTANDPEAFYHGLMIGLTASLYGNKNYLLKSNHESGYGRYDYLILSKDPKRPTLLLELKRVKANAGENSTKLLQQLETAAQEALQQIEQQSYSAEVQQQGVTHLIKIGLAFCGKRFKLKAIEAQS